MNDLACAYTYGEGQDVKLSCQASSDITNLAIQKTYSIITVIIPSHMGRLYGHIKYN
jgi:hypothetical protein